MISEFQVAQWVAVAKLAYVHHSMAMRSFWILSGRCDTLEESLGEALMLHKLQNVKCLSFCYTYIRRRRSINYIYSCRQSISGKRYGFFNVARSRACEENGLAETA